MLTSAIQIALALELLLVCAEAIIPKTSSYLPLGGSNLAQIGCVLAIAVAMTEICSTVLP